MITIKSIILINLGILLSDNYLFDSNFNSIAAALAYDIFMAFFDSLFIM